MNEEPSSAAPKPAAPKPRDPRDFLFKVDFVRYMEILTAQWGFIAVFTGAAVLTSLALTYVFSEQYLGAVAIYYRPVDLTVLRQRNAESFGGPVPQAPFKIISQTLNDVVKSEAIIRPVVEELQLDREVERKYGSWYEKLFHETKKAVKGVMSDAWEILKYGRLIDQVPANKAVEGLSEALSVASTKDSYIYVLSVKDQYPERAAAIVDTVGKHLVQWSKRQDQGPAERRRDHLSGEIQAKENEIADMRRERDDILKGNGIVSIGEEVNTGMQSQYSLQVEMERIVALEHEKRQRLSEIAAILATRSTRYIDPDHVKRLEEERLLTDIELKALAAKRGSLQSSIGRMQERLQFVLSTKKRIEEMDARIEAAARENQHVSDMFVEAREGSQVHDAEVKVLHAATVPTRPVQPIKIYHVGLTLLLALVFSTGLVYVFSYFNVRVFFHSRKPPALSELGTPGAPHG